MNIRLSISVAAALILGACTDHAAGQKGQAPALRTVMDSVSYGIGTDIGHNIKMSGLDSLNIDALVDGLRDGVDSTEKIASEKVRVLVQTYMLEAQKKAMAKEQAAGEAVLRQGEAWLTENGKKPGVITTATGLQYTVITEGKGPKATVNDMVTVKYAGSLISGEEFDSSDRHGGPSPYPVNKYIPGWTEALQMMSVGSKYKLFVPSNLAYGAQGMGEAIPPYSALVFDVELLDIQPMPKQ
jgi:FKBP-type peptidyl-prolyl cis-trans isomerase FklB